MLEPFEPRRLCAASATLRNGVLGVVGTNNSDTIVIDAKLNVVQLNRLGSPSQMVVETYTVTVNGIQLGNFTSTEVTRINVFALGGNDKVAGPAPLKLKHGPIMVIDGVRTYGNPAFVSVNETPIAPLYIEGGSGRDGIYGSTGNDTLKGGRGDDVIVDPIGQNTIDGGQGNDWIQTQVSIRNYGFGQPSYSAIGRGKDRITCGAGQDTVGTADSDELVDTPEETMIFALAGIRTTVWGEG